MEHEVQLETLESKADRLFSGNDDVEVWKSDGVDLGKTGMGMCL